MKGIKTTIGVMVLIFILVKSDFSLFGQKVTVEKFLSTLKTGEWVKFEGTVQEDSTILLKEIKVIYGEFENDDWELSGVIRSVVPEEKMVFMLLLPIKFDKDSKYKKDIKSFSDIQPGTYVEIEGSFLEDGTFLAVEIEPENIKNDEENTVEWTGKVQSVNPESNSFTILGHTVILMPETKIKSLIHD